MLIIIKVNVAKEPGVCEFLSGTIKPLVATQVSSCSECSHFRTVDSGWTNSKPSVQAYLSQIPA